MMSRNILDSLNDVQQLKLLEYGISLQDYKKMRQQLLDAGYNEANGITAADLDAFFFDACSQGSSDMCSRYRVVCAILFSFSEKIISSPYFFTRHQLINAASSLVRSGKKIDDYFFISLAKENALARLENYTSLSEGITLFLKKNRSMNRVMLLANSIQYFLVISDSIDIYIRLFLNNDIHYAVLKHVVDYIKYVVTQLEIIKNNTTASYETLKERLVNDMIYEGNLISTHMITQVKDTPQQRVVKNLVEKILCDVKKFVENITQEQVQARCLKSDELDIFKQVLEKCLYQVPNNSSKKLKSRSKRLRGESNEIGSSSAVCTESLALAAQKPTKDNVSQLPVMESHPVRNKRLREESVKEFEEAYNDYIRNLPDEVANTESLALAAQKPTKVNVSQLPVMESHPVRNKRLREESVKKFEEAYNDYIRNLPDKVANTESLAPAAKKPRRESFSVINPHSFFSVDSSRVQNNPDVDEEEAALRNMLAFDLKSIS